ncbi:MAG: hypothetical protein B7Y41_14030 [Hydrogenophilales bacterium 28-61-23]|nr:MAG: hypothetical protein B7Y41_14030 [Hydrogenophilales bacterium 28-61-23]
MLENFIFTGRELLLAVVLATLVYLLETWLFSRRGGGRTPAISIRKASEIRADLDQIRIDALEAEIVELKKRINALEEQPPAGSALDPRAATYADAQRMAREGTSATELASSLGISRSEAELIISLQRAESGSS